MSDKEYNFPKKRGAKNASIEANLKSDTSITKSLISECMVWFKQPMVQSDDECLERMIEFFQYYAMHGGIPTVEKLSLALGVDRTTLFDWEHGVKGDERANLIKKAKTILSSLDADLALKGHINPVVYIFRSKNYYGMKDQQDVFVQARNVFGSDVSRDEIERRLLEDTTIETTATIAEEAPPTIGDKPEE